MNSETVLLVGCPINQASRCISQAKSRGLQVVVLETAELIEKGLTVLSAADQIIAMPSKAVVHVKKWLEGQPEFPKIDHILTFSEYAVEATALIAQHLNIPWNTPDNIRVIKDKFLLRNKLKEKGINQPDIAACSTIQEAIHFLEQSGSQGPWIVKPRIGLGSEGVSIVRQKSDLQAAFENLSQEDRQAFLIEEYVVGQEYSVEGVLISGEAQFFGITKKILIDNDTFIECGHIIPAPISKNLAQKIYAEVRKAIDAVELRYGLFHVEFWVNENAITLGEIHARPGGGFINWMTELVTDIETYGIALDDLRGQVTPPPATWPSNAYVFSKSAGINYLQPAPGIIEQMGDLESIRQHPHCVRLHCTLRAGDTVPEVTSWKDLESIGYLIVTGENSAQVEQLLRHFQKEAAIITKPNPK
ncbi:ATP-grasp domain-containing protein [Xenorhabdus sp. 12]|uniref:ATP-grasp domain-containing protein n=1 Tax=Xenorhabdus santafensis TaxID=2582833 RepID=A0ABU4S543_9GAMM|nr:ATP-grasp domain-containing protein [Xenorhabdus sp. 12]MDX7986329.1 ATP-grasp domain-containing protein [Xenorhabdus sp. 12]